MLFLWWGVGTLIFYKAAFAAFLSPYESAHLGLVSAILMAATTSLSIFLSARPYATALGHTLGRASFENVDAAFFWRLAWWVPVVSSVGVIASNWLIIYGFSPRTFRVISFEDPWHSWFSYGTRYLLICAAPAILQAAMSAITVTGFLQRTATRRMAESQEPPSSPPRKDQYF